MPASSFSAALNASVYLLASALFLGFTHPILDRVYTSAEIETLHSIADGLQMEIDSLAPGMTTKFVFYSPQAPFTISLHAHSVTANLDGVKVVKQVKWALPDLTLFPGKDYAFSLIGQSVSVAESRGS